MYMLTAFSCIPALMLDRRLLRASEAPGGSDCLLFAETEAVGCVSFEDSEGSGGGGGGAGIPWRTHYNFIFWYDISDALTYWRWRRRWRSRWSHWGCRQWSRTPVRRWGWSIPPFCGWGLWWYLRRRWGWGLWAWWMIGHGLSCGWGWRSLLLGFLQLPVGLLNAPTFFNKVVNEFCSLFVLQLFMGDPNCVQKLLPIRGDVVYLHILETLVSCLVNTLYYHLTSKFPVLASIPTWAKCLWED